MLTTRPMKRKIEERDGIEHQEEKDRKEGEHEEEVTHFPSSAAAYIYRDTGADQSRTHLRQSHRYPLTHTQFQPRSSETPSNISTPRT